MTKETLNNKLDALKREYEACRLVIIRTYCKENNPYKKGDIATDHLGSIQITKITACSSLEMIYEGIVLKADGKPRLDGSTRRVYQSNIKGV